MDCITHLITLSTPCLHSEKRSFWQFPSEFVSCELFKLPYSHRHKLIIVQTIILNHSSNKSGVEYELAVGSRQSECLLAVIE